MKTVLITGASRGLGKAFADVFKKNDFRIISLSTNKYNGMQISGLSINENENLIEVYGDIRSIETISALNSISNNYDIDILINNAAIYLKKNIFETRNIQIEEIININLLSQIRLTKAIWPIFAKKQSGMIININSLAGRYMDTKEAAYCISKHAFHAFTESLRVQAMFNNIRVLEVFLGAMKTDMTKDRAEYDKLIPPEDAATTIYKMVENPDTLNVNEITIKRTYY